MNGAPLKGGRNRWPRSFRRRQGKVTRAQKRALRELWPLYGVEFSYGHKLDLDAAFGHDGKTFLEIGFGHGENLIRVAKERPEWRILGVEVHRPGIGAALIQIEEEGLKNIRIIRGDVLHILSDYLEGLLFDETCVFFPDPWPERDEREHRLIRPLFAELLHRRMRPDGLLHIATDIAAYAQHALQVMDTSPLWENREGEGHYAPRPDWRPITLYEGRAHEEGRDVFDLSYRTKR